MPIRAVRGAVTQLDSPHTDSRLMHQQCTMSGRTVPAWRGSLWTVSRLPSNQERVDCALARATIVSRAAKRHVLKCLEVCAVCGRSLYPAEQTHVNRRDREVCQLQSVMANAIGRPQPRYRTTLP
eukprot:1416474-Prymnesium_polylepis.1